MNRRRKKNKLSSFCEYISSEHFFVHSNKHLASLLSLKSFRVIRAVQLIFNVFISNTFSLFE